MLPMRWCSFYNTYWWYKITTVKSFITLAPGVDLIKLVWCTFTYSILLARSFHGNATKSLLFIKWSSSLQKVWVNLCQNSLWDLPQMDMSWHLETKFGNNGPLFFKMNSLIMTINWHQVFWSKTTWSVDIWLIDILVNRHLVNRHLVNRHLVNRHLVNRHLVNRHLVNRHLVNRHLVNSIWSTNIWSTDIWSKQTSGQQTLGQLTFG